MKRYIDSICYCDDNCCNNFSNGSFYSLFFGLNDKCTGTQMVQSEQAMTFIQNVCARYFVNGYTILDGVGANRGSSTEIEPSVYIMATNATKSSVFQVAEIFQRQFNQSEILIEQNPTRYLYFNSR